MNQYERRIYLIKYLIEENPEYLSINIPTEECEQKKLLRSLMNVRMPLEISRDFIEIQNQYLQKRAVEKGIISIDDLYEIDKNIYLWQGDITRLKCQAIVNAGNWAMLGCFHPCHSCIDNAIHTFAGVQLRLECDEIMKKHKRKATTSSVIITSAYNLPCKYIIHTVGPIINGCLKESDCLLLENCYYNALKLAERNGIRSIAFCCISTGEFCFPNDKAAKIAVETVKKYMNDTNNTMKVIFNVFKEKDYGIYRKLLE